MKIFYIRNLLVAFSIIFITLISFSKTNEVVFYHTASHLIIHSPTGKFRPQDENQQLKYRTRVNILKLKIAEQLKNRSNGTNQPETSNKALTTSQESTGHGPPREILMGIRAGKQALDKALGNPQRSPQYRGRQV